MINKNTATDHQQTRMLSKKDFNLSESSLLKYILIILIIAIHSLESQASVSNLLSSHPKPPPIPILPIPTSQQLSWQFTEMAIFLHFGTNTFTDSEWGTGHVDPSVFNPTALNATQWVSVAKETGFSRVILTAKHHDGFCLWQSDYTDYSVKSSPWKNGTGDVVKELAEAARIAGLQLGLYLSPWDRHEPCYGKTLEYNEYYLGQMSELLTRYGEIREVWLDAAKDTRWIGNEGGVAGTTCWSLFNRSNAEFGDTDHQYSGEGDPLGHDWVPAECDVSIRPGWFWHASEVPKSAMTLLDLYYESVGRNCLLLLNVPPNSSGLISQEDIQVLQEFSEIRGSIFSHNLAEGASISASSTRGSPSDSRYGSHNLLEDSIYSYWAPDETLSDWILYLDFREVVTFNVLLVQEPIQMGQRIIKFHLDFLNENGEWELVTTGSTVGYKRLLKFHSVKASHLRLVVEKSRADPLISYLGIYMDLFSIFGHISKLTSGSSVNGSEPLRQTTQRNSNSYYI
ncbi:alpha-L-fucosidase 1 isoform X2 [Sesamum indicum]|uniref:alpha-L-fucosidase n=1 Tax=Sesamum indicum TaxID=4182 RepID=A0A8M8V146_SESIN|nr:alpha-L-fucosidase 1 isoform X2 [Sesamum indicum]